MDKKTRMLNAMNAQPVDRVPVGFWFHFAGDEAVGDGCVEAHLRYHRDCDTDFIKIMCDNYFPYPISIPHDRADDWQQLRPLGEHHPFIEEQVERAKLIREAVGDECAVFYNVFAPFSSIRFGASDELVMRHIRENPKAVMHALDAIGEDNAALTERLIREAGCEGVYYCVQGGELERFTYEEYRQMITPSDLFVLKRANECSENNIMHMCGWAGIQNRVDVWKDYPVKTINWAVFVEGIELRDGFERFGCKSVLGGFQSTKAGLLYNGTEQEIKAYTKELLEKTGTRGVILGGDCTIQPDIDRRRITWVMEAAAEFGA